METISTHHGAVQPGCRSAPAQRGFTFVELIAVMVLIGVLSATAYSRLGNNGYDAAGYRDQVTATIAFARKAAIAQRRCVRVELGANMLRFRIATDVPESANGCTNFDGAAGRDLILPGVGESFIEPKGATGLSGPASLRFTPLGTTADTSRTYVYAISGTPGYTITVDAVSGHVY